MADAGWFEGIKTVGSLVGLLTGMFVVFDRFVRNQPIVDVRPVHNAPQLELVITNVSNRSIVIRGIECQPDALAAAYGDNIDATVRAAAGLPARALMAPQEKKVFIVITRPTWDGLPTDMPVSIVVRWSFTGSTWLPQIPIRWRSSVEAVNELRKLPRKKD
jgi:hypothetical protein